MLIPTGYRLAMPCAYPPRFRPVAGSLKYCGCVPLIAPCREQWPMTAQAGGAALLMRSIGHPCHDDREKSKKCGFCFSPPRRCETTLAAGPVPGPYLDLMLLEQFQVEI